jgi:hypothetical protein
MQLEPRKNLAPSQTTCPLPENRNVFARTNLVLCLRKSTLNPTEQDETELTDEVGTPFSLLPPVNSLAWVAEPRRAAVLSGSAAGGVGRRDSCPSDRGFARSSGAILEDLGQRLFDLRVEVVELLDQLVVTRVEAVEKFARCGHGECREWMVESGRAEARQPEESIGSGRPWPRCGLARNWRLGRSAWKGLPCGTVSPWRQTATRRVDRTKPVGRSVGIPETGRDIPVMRAQRGSADSRPISAHTALPSIKPTPARRRLDQAPTSHFCGVLLGWCGRSGAKVATMMGPRPQGLSSRRRVCRGVS